MPITFAPLLTMTTTPSSSAFTCSSHSWSSTARRPYCLPPMSTWTRSSKQHHTWSQGHTFQWHLARLTTHSSPCSPRSPCASTRLSSRRAQHTCHLAKTSLPTSTPMPTVAGSWSSMMARTSSSNISSTSRCTGSTCSRGSGTNWRSAWLCQTNMAPKHVTTRPWPS